MAFSKLSECCEFVKDGTHGSPVRAGGGIPVLSASNVVNGYLDFNTDRFTTDEELRLFRERLHPQKGDVLLTIVGTIGRVAVLTENRPLVFQRSVCVLRPKENHLDSVYLRYVLESNDVKLQLDRETHEVAQAGVYLESLNKIEIPLPPLVQQKRIAAVLEKADSLRRQRHYALELSSTYLQSVFLEMFGDPSENPKGWKIEHLGDRISFLTSGSRGWAQYYSNEGAIFLRIQNVGMDQLLLDDLAYVQVPDGAEGQRTRVKTGDLLLSITADLGRTAVIPENFPEAYINQHLALLRLQELNPVFVAGFISAPGGQAQIMRLDRAGVKSGLNFDDIRGFQIFVPPRPLQVKFAQIVQKFERLRTQQREADRQAEHLFQTLLHQAFQENIDIGPAIAQNVSTETGVQLSEVSQQFTKTYVQLQLKY